MSDNGLQTLPQTTKGTPPPTPASRCVSDAYNAAPRSDENGVELADSGGETDPGSTEVVLGSGLGGCDDAQSEESETSSSYSTRACHSRCENPQSSSSPSTTVKYIDVQWERHREDYRAKEMAENEQVWQDYLDYYC